MPTPETSGQPKDEFVTLNGKRFHYLALGDAAAPPLVVLHGITGWARSWDTFAEAMSDRFRVLAIDQRGHGESEWADDYAPGRMAEDVEAFRRELGLARFVLLGYSMGGIVGWMYATSHPNVVERLVIGDFGPDVTGSTAGAGAAAARRASRQDTFGDPEEALAVLQVRNPRFPAEHVRRRVYEQLGQREDGRWVWQYDALGLGTFEERAPAEADQWAMLARIACPTLLVHGAESVVLSRETADRMVATIPGCRLVEVPDAGHGVPFEQPEAFLAAVRPFLLGEAD